MVFFRQRKRERERWTENQPARNAPILFTADILTPPTPNDVDEEEAKVRSIVCECYSWMKNESESRNAEVSNS